MATSRLYAVVVAMWCVAGASAHIIQLHAGQSECLYEEFGVEHLLAGESEATVPTEVALAFVVRAHKAGPSTISNPVAVNASDPYGTLLVQKTGAYEEVCPRGIPSPVSPLYSLTEQPPCTLRISYRQVFERNKRTQ
jgi:hypothetical protein